MNVTMLRQLLRSLGQIPGNRPKEDLVRECLRLYPISPVTILSFSTKGTGSKDTSSSSDQVASSLSAVFAPAPLEDNNSAMAPRNLRKAKPASAAGSSRNEPKAKKDSTVDASIDSYCQSSSMSSSCYSSNDFQTGNSVINGTHRSTNVTSSNKRLRFPIESNRQLRFEESPSSEMELKFLGTASCVPSMSRGVSCVALRYNRETWLFDCGESTQIQFQKSTLRASRVRKIFLTHNHGDHFFGLPGMLCLMGQSTMEERGKLTEDGDALLEPVDIYGPEGLRDFLRAVMQISYSRIATPYRVHELKNVPFLHGRYTRKPNVPKITTQCDSTYGERPGGRDIYPDENGIYHLEEATEDHLGVKAAPMQHSVPCVGYVVQEFDREGRLKIEDVEHIVERNLAALNESPKYRKRPRSVLATLKSLKNDETFTFPDGTVVGADVVEPKQKGRKVVIMGDTCSGDAIKPIAQDADVLIHEATNAFLPSLLTPSEKLLLQRLQAKAKQQTPAAGAKKSPQASLGDMLRQDTIYHGHSTPEMAAKFAQQINAKQLVLTHFSAKYSGEANEWSMRIMWQIEDLARRACHLKGENDVVAAWDQLFLFVPPPNVAVSPKTGDTSVTTAPAKTE